MITHTCFKKKGANRQIRRGVLMAIFYAGLLIPRHALAQTDEPGTGDVNDEKEEVHHHRRIKPPEPVYPKTAGYLSFILNTGTLQNNKVTYNFTNNTKIGFPVGMNVYYSAHFGFSLEFTPTIKVVTLNGSSSMSNFLFDPGVMFRFKHGFTIIPRLAFETSGRYGLTPVFNEVYLRTKAVNYFVAMSLPCRWGSDNGVMETGSIGLNVQFGFIFN